MLETPEYLDDIAYLVFEPVFFRETASGFNSPFALNSPESIAPLRGASVLYFVCHYDQEPVDMDLALGASSFVVEKGYTKSVAPEQKSDSLFSHQAKPDGGLLIAQRSASALASGSEAASSQITLVPDSVLYARHIVDRIRANQTLNFLWWQLSKEMSDKRWFITFMGCANRVDFCEYSGYIFDEFHLPRVEFSGTIRPSRAGCQASVLSDESRHPPVNINELHKAPEDEYYRLRSLLAREAEVRSFVSLPRA